MTCSKCDLPVSELDESLCEEHLTESLVEFIQNFDPAMEELPTLVLFDPRSN